MLEMVEAGTEQAVDLGYGEKAYFASLERVLRSVVGELRSLPESSRPAIVERLRQLADKAEGIGWGYGDYVREITLPATSSGPGQENARPRRPGSGRAGRR